MQNHNLSPTLECDGALSDLILQAARQALPANPEQIIRIPPSGRRNGPLLPLLIGLIDAAQVTARAVGDNAWEDGHPLDSQLSRDLAAQCRVIAAVLDNARECTAAGGWSLPSATGKELI